MPRIIPIRDLKNTSEISQLCHSVKEPIYITKNGYGDMVIMSMETYNERMYMSEVYEKLVAAEEQVEYGKVLNANDVLKKLRDKNNV